MNVIIHRGSRQIGGSCLEVFTDKARIILDIGAELPPIGEKNTGRGENRSQGKEREFGRGQTESGINENQPGREAKPIDALIISHGHGDHIGLIQDIYPDIPVFIGEKALHIYHMTGKFTGKNIIPNPTSYLQSGKEFVIGDLNITPYLVDHSGFDSYAFLIRQGKKTLVYTGDFRDHGRKKKATDYFIDKLPEGMDLLLIEGTMMTRGAEKVATEETIENEAYTFMKSQGGPVFVLQSSTNIDRLVGMYRAAKRSGRIFVMDIFTANIVAGLNNTIPQPGIFKDVRVFYPYYLTKKMFKEPGGEYLMRRFSQYKITREELTKRKDYCMLVRDSMLSDLQHIKNLHGAGFIYSLWSGYKGEIRVQEILDYAKQMVMKIIALHTSGHISRESLGKMIDKIKPRKVVPIHTENPYIFAKEFPNVYLPQDGEIISV
ncbi:MAG: MBL fold metallo-hydrolase [Desulfitobacterium sp.]|nr:MBL fold metallo-hydrolase [Desulfitobacterium sp.]